MGARVCALALRLDGFDSSLRKGSASGSDAIVVDRSAAVIRTAHRANA